MSPFSCSTGFSTTPIALPLVTSPPTIRRSASPPLARSAPKVKLPERLPSKLSVLPAAPLRASIEPSVMNTSAPVTKLSPPVRVIAPRSISKRLLPPPKSMTELFSVMLPVLVTQPGAVEQLRVDQRVVAVAEDDAAADLADVDDVGVEVVVGVETDRRARGIRAGLDRSGVEDLRAAELRRARAGDHDRGRVRAGADRAAVGEVSRADRIGRPRHVDDAVIAGRIEYGEQPGGSNSRPTPS